MKLSEKLAALEEEERKATATTPSKYTMAKLVIARNWETGQLTSVHAETIKVAAR